MISSFKKIISKNVELLKNMFYLNFNNITLFLIPLIVIPILLRRIGVEQYGVFVFTFAFISYFKTLIDFGFEISSQKYIVLLEKEDYKGRSKIFSEILYYKLFLSIISIVIFLIIIFLTPLSEKASISIFFLQLINIIAATLNINTFLYAFHDIKILTIFNAIGRFFFLITVIFFVQSPENLNLLIILNALSYIIPAIVLFFYAKNKYHLSYVRIRNDELGNLVNEAKDAFVSNLSVSLYGPTNAFLIGLFVSPAIVGVFSTVEKVYNAITSLLSSTALVFYPILIDKFGQSVDAFKIYLKRIEIFYVLISTFMAIILFTTKGLIVNFFFGVDFIYQDYTLWFFNFTSVALLFSSYGGLFSRCFMMLGYSKYLIRFTFVGFLINLITVLLVIYSKKYIWLMLPILLTQMFIAISKKYFLHQKISKL